MMTLKSDYLIQQNVKQNGCQHKEIAKSITKKRSRQRAWQWNPSPMANRFKINEI